MTKTPLVVRWNEKAGHWNVAIGRRGGTVNTRPIGTREEAIAMANRNADGRPGVIVAPKYPPGSIHDDIEALQPNATYWRTAGWTDEHPAPVIVKPDGDGWALWIGSHKKVDSFDLKSSAADAAKNVHENVPAIVQYYNDGSYQGTSMNPRYWERWV